MRDLRWTAGLVALLGLVLTSACAQTSATCLVDSAASRSVLERGKVAVLPVAAPAEEVPLPELQVLDGLLEVAFERHAAGMPRPAPRDVQQAISGSQANWDSMVQYSNTGTLTRVGLKRLAASIGARYLMFTTVSYDATRDPFATYSRWADKRAMAGDYRAPTSAGRLTPFDPREGSGERLDSPFVEDAVSRLTGTMQLVDGITGEVIWQDYNEVLRDHGNMQIDNPSRLAYTLFSEMVAHLPGAS